MIGMATRNALHLNVLTTFLLANLIPCMDRLASHPETDFQPWLARHVSKTPAIFATAPWLKHVFEIAELMFSIFSEHKEIFYSNDIRKKHHQKFGHHFVNCIYMKILIDHTVIILFSLLFVVFRAQRFGDYTNSSLGAVRLAIQFQNRMQRKANANRCFDSTLLQELIATWLLTSRPHAMMVFNRGFISTHFLFSARCFLVFL